MNSTKLRAGAAEVDITPLRGMQLDGDIGRYRPAEVVLDPLYAKALVVESDGRKICILSLDLLAISEQWASKIRQLAVEKFGFEFEAVMVHVTQNHSAPSMGLLMLNEDCPYVPAEAQWLKGGGTDEYSELALNRILEAIALAIDRLETAYIETASGIDGRVAFNRRYVMRDGRTVMLPGKGHPDIRYMEGPSDPEVGVMCITTESLGTMALLLHHTCHPVHGYPHRYVSADWPGAWSDEARKIHGQNCVPLIINGCCGNVYHGNHLDPDYVEDYQVMGKLLMETTTKVLKRMTFQDEPILDWKTTTIRIPKRELDQDRVKAAHQLIAQYPEPMWIDQEHQAVEWKWMYAVSMLELEERNKHEPMFDYEIQVFRIGDAAIVALGGEPFVEGQLKIKLESAARYTYIAHMSNYYVGYIPTPEAIRRGGYETEAANWSKLVPEALDMISDAAVALIKEVF